MTSENKQTKITMTVWDDLFALFSNKLDRCFIKRDAFLNHVISVELANLKRGVEGKKNSAVAKRYISSNLKALGTKSINVVVDKQVANDLNNLVKEHNLVRDAFVNRLLLLLSFPDNIISHIFDVRLTQVIDSETESCGYSEMAPPPRTFISALEFMQKSPNFYLQEELTHCYGEDSNDIESNVYTKSLDLTSIIENLESGSQKDFFRKLDSHRVAFSCYLDDRERKNIEVQDTLEKALADFSLPKKGE